MPLAFGRGFELGGVPLASLAASYPVVLRAMEEGTEEVMILNEIAWSEIVKKIMVLSYRMVLSRTLDVILSRASRTIVSRIKALTCDDLLHEEAAATPRTCPARGSSNSEFVNRCAEELHKKTDLKSCLLYTSPSPRDQRGSRMPSSA